MAAETLASPRPTSSEAAHPNLSSRALHHKVISLDEEVMGRKYARGLRLFAYDARLPLRIHATPSPSDGYTQLELSNASPLGGRVPATLLIPQGRGPFPALILQHGLPGNRSDILFIAEDYARLGVLTLLRAEDLDIAPLFPAMGGGSVWTVDHNAEDSPNEGGAVFRIDPRTLGIVQRIELGANPASVSFGQGGAWVALKSGEVVRIGLTG